jgi:HEXXH motif-containing protein
MPAPGPQGDPRITTHSLTAYAFAELAGGAGGSAVVGELREAQASKHLMLLSVIARAAGRADPSSPAVVAFDVGYGLLARVQAAHPDVVAQVLGLPHIGSWAHDCLACLDSGSPVDFGYLATVAAAVAVRAGVPFETDVPVRDGRVVLPGLGWLEVTELGEWISLSSNGECLRVGGRIQVACAALVPDDGSPFQAPVWRGAPLIRAVADGHAWEVLLETADRHLDRYALPMRTGMTAAEVTHWRKLIQSAWELLVRHHAWAAGPIGDGISVIVPLVPRSDLDSASSLAAFGAIATSAPPSPVSLAETLIHEFQHVKLGGLLDMVPLVQASDKRGYAPWREDPRPMGGLLQGVYAFTGIAHFWDAQRHIETDPDEWLRASVLYARWRSTIAPVTSALLESGDLTPAGVRFVTALRRRGLHQRSRPVPPEALEMASEVALDNWLTWQLRHTALDAVEVAGLAAAFIRGESLGDRVLPEARIAGGVRKIGSAARSRLLNMRFQEPDRYRQVSTADVLGLGPADVLLIRGNATAAIAAYREGLAAVPDPAAWIGLALAIHRLGALSSRSVFAARLPLLFEVHASLADHEIHADPLDVAGWLE